MIDIKLLRENPGLVKENMKKKFQQDKLKLVDEVLALDEKWRKLKYEEDCFSIGSSELCGECICSSERPRRANGAVAVPEQRELRRSHDWQRHHIQHGIRRAAFGALD